MGRQYRIKNADAYEKFGLKVGDVVTLVEDTVDDDVYELPKHLHGKGIDVVIYTKPSSVKERNYVYIYRPDLEEIKEELK